MVKYIRLNREACHMHVHVYVSIAIKGLIGASLSEPHIDEFAVNFLYIYIYICIVRRAVNHFLVVFCVFLRHALFPT